MKGYSTHFRLDRNQNGGGLLLYLGEDIPCNFLNEHTSEKPIENIYVGNGSCHVHAIQIQN